MDTTKLDRPGFTRVLPTHELNARRRRKRTVAPNLPVPDGQRRTPPAERAVTGPDPHAKTQR